MTTAARTTSTVDPERLRRALPLDVARLDDGSHVVTGGADPHHVRGRECDCLDTQFSGEVCKHRLSVYLHARLDGRVLAALRAALNAGDRATPRNRRPTKGHEHDDVSA